MSAVNVKTTDELFTVLVKTPSEENEKGDAVTSFEGVPASSVKSALVGVWLYVAEKIGFVDVSPISSKVEKTVVNVKIENAGAEQSSTIVPVKDSDSVIVPVI